MRKNADEILGVHLEACSERIVTTPYIEVYERVKEVIINLDENPRPSGCKKLTAREGWRIQVGDYRVVYEIDDKAKKVVILHVGHRRDVYR